MPESARPYRVLLVDDHQLFRSGLKRLFQEDKRFEVAGDFGSAAEALRAVSQGMRFDVALVDYDLTPTERIGSGMNFVANLRTLSPKLNVLLLTAGMSVHALHHAIYKLQTGVLFKSESEEELVLATLRTAQGHRWITTSAALQMQAHQGLETAASKPFSAKELRVLRGILEGLGNKEIGSRLELSESAVKTVMQKLFEKAGVRSRSQLVRHVIDRQIDLGSEL